jgi:hypothetical protein
VGGFEAENGENRQEAEAAEICYGMDVSFYLFAFQKIDEHGHLEVGFLSDGHARSQESHPDEKVSRQLFREGKAAHENVSEKDLRKDQRDHDTQRDHHKHPEHTIYVCIDFFQYIHAYHPSHGASKTPVFKSQKVMCPVS